MPLTLDDLPEIVKTILDDAGIDLDLYDGCRYTDRGDHYFVALFPADDVDESVVESHAKRVDDAGTHAGIGTRGWLLLPKVDKPGAIDTDVEVHHADDPEPAD